MDKLSLNSYAKLNLYLEVLNKRSDGYHNIKTLFERIDLCDKIILKNLSSKRIKIISSCRFIPKDKNNLVFKSAKLLQDEFGLNKGVQIKIIKRIPVGSGMGGGSSNAAAVLMGLNKLWKLGLTNKELLDFGRRIGADVNFFIYNAKFALGEGRGDCLTELKVLNNIRLWHILVVPAISVSTPLSYKRWDRLKGSLTRPKYNVKILTSAIVNGECELRQWSLFNSLEQISTRLYPQIKYVKDLLQAYGVKSILMSGSGPAVFGIVSSRKEAVALHRKLKTNKGIGQAFVVRTC